VKRQQDRSRCPGCGEHVTPFAAGCSWCGTDLDFRRWDTGPNLGQRAGSWARALGSGPKVGRGGRGPSSLGEYVVTYALLSICVSAVAGGVYALASVV
jgi:hypothetical protein